MIRRRRTTSTPDWIQAIIENHGIPDAILTSDWHLRDTVPACRTDNYEEAQWRKVYHISLMQKAFGCPVLHAADLFHHWKPSPYLIAKALEWMPDMFYTIYGNHDLPQHNLELAEKCGIYALHAADKVSILDGVHWGYKPDGDISFEIKGRKILVWHTMTYQGKVPYPGCTDTPAAGLLRKYKEYDLILTGHNHQQFVEHHEGRVLLNPGAIFRQESDEAEFEPKIWFYYADTNEVIAHVIPHEKGVVSRPENVVKTDERNNRIDAFISKLDDNWQGEVSFEQNLERALQENEVEKDVEKIIYKSIE